MQSWRNISLWMDQIDDPLQPRPGLHTDVQADVAIIGAGFTGLWTAYYLKQHAPELKVVILEAQMAGFGASGRNGGWLMGNLLGEERLIGGLPTERRKATLDLMHGIPAEVAAVTAREGIDCDLRSGGAIYAAARYPEQEVRLREYLAHLHELGSDERDYRWLGQQELAEQLRLANAYGAIYTPHISTIHPAKLVRGLARTVERLGVTIYEKSAVEHWQPGLVRSAHGSVKADWVVPAVEGYAATLPPLGNYQLPVQSLIVATEPLPADVWQEIGLDKGQAFSEFSRQVTYGQRTKDDRLVFGARGGYRFGGRLRTDFSLTDDEQALRRYLMGEIFPQLRNVRFTHGWGGNLGMSRRFQPHMLRDCRQRVAISGGYGGEGVGATNLGGRTLADLILGRDTELVHQPWVIADNPISSLKRWEPEPCRWLGYNAIIRSFVHEDEVLANPHSPAWRRRLAQGLAERMEALMTWKVG